jgi:hypothetical protein
MFLINSELPDGHLKKGIEVFKDLISLYSPGCLLTFSIVLATEA